MFYIYRLTDGEQDYYGQTEDYEKRLSGHKCPSERTMSRLLNKDNMEIHVLHTLYSKQEADETEQFYILNMECVNNNVPLRTVKEWREVNREKIKEYTTEYYQTNKEKYNQKFNCECGGKYTDAHRSRHMKSNKHQDYISR